MRTFELENGHSIIVEDTDREDSYNVTFLEDGKPLMGSELESKDYIEWFYGIEF